MTASTGRKAANNERLRALCKDGTRQSALAKRNPRRHAFNGVSIALASSPNYKPRTTNG